MHNIIIIQRHYRIYKINKIIKKIKEYKLFNENDFIKYKKIMMNKDLINMINFLLKWLQNCNSLHIKNANYQFFTNINSKKILTAIMIYNYPDEILGNIKDRHPIDTLLLHNIIIMVNSLLNIKQYSDIQKLINQINAFEELFNEWKNMDKNRTIQHIIISYKHRQDHINKINNSTDQDKHIVEILNNECNIMLKTILTIDPTYDIDYVKDNYDDIYNMINVTMHEIENKIKSNFQKAYIDYLVYEFSHNNDMHTIKNLILETNERIISFVPSSVINSIKNKLNQYNYDKMLLENDWTNDFNDYFKFIIDTIICCNKNINININTMKLLYNMVGNNYQYNVPYILVNINILIDNI